MNGGPGFVASPAGSSPVLARQLDEFVMSLDDRPDVRDLVIDVQRGANVPITGMIVAQREISAHAISPGGLVRDGRVTLWRYAVQLADTVTTYCQHPAYRRTAFVGTLHEILPAWTAGDVSNLINPVRAMMLDHVKLVALRPVHSRWNSTPVTRWVVDQNVNGLLDVHELEHWRKR